MSRKGAPAFSSLLKDCVLWATMQDSAGVSGGIDEFPILPSGVTVTNNGTFTKTDLGNNKSVLNFDGSTNYISLSDNASWDFYNGDFTVCAWLMITETLISNKLYAIIAKTNTSANRFYIAYNTTYGAISLFGMVSGVKTAQMISSGFVPTLNTWYHVVMQRSGSSCLMYLNSESMSVSVDTTFSTTNISTPLEICRSYSGTYMYNASKLKDLMIFKGRVLSAAEIKLLMARTHPITGTGLMPANGDYWRTS